MASSLVVPLRRQKRISCLDNEQVILMNAALSESNEGACDSMHWVLYFLNGMGAKAPKCSG